MNHITRLGLLILLALPFSSHCLAIQVSCDRAPNPSQSGDTLICIAEWSSAEAAIYTSVQIYVASKQVPFGGLQVIFNVPFPTNPRLPIGGWIINPTETYSLQMAASLLAGDSAYDWTFGWAPW